MPTPDFSKIFGTNATSTQNWSDSNYLTGWGFLGQAPPPYQLFDDYFKNTDTKLKWLYDNFGSIDVTTAINTHNLDIESHPKLNFNILKRNNAYSIGDIAYSSTLPSWVQLQCKTAGTTGANEPTWGTLAPGQEITDGTVAWIVYDIKGGDGISLGTIMPHLVTSIPAGWIDVSTGAEVSRTTYSKLWEWVQSNAPLISESAWLAQASTQSSVGAYSTGDGSTTFRLPRIVDYVRGGVVADVGKWQGDAIRNITGTFDSYSNVVSGAISSELGVNLLYSGSSARIATKTFDASLTVPTADENRPKTIKLVYCVKAFGSPTNQGLIDITQLANDVAGKQTATKYIKIVDKKTFGTAGGTFTSGAWRTRDLNTIEKDDTTMVTVSSNQITLPAGTYEVDIMASAQACNSNRTRLYNITGSVTLLDGSTEYASATYAGKTNSYIKGKIILANTTVVEIQHYCTTTGTYGTAMNVSGIDEIYTTATFRKMV